MSAVLPFSADQIRNEPSLLLLLLSPFFFREGRLAARPTSVLDKLCVAMPLLDLDLPLLPLAGMYTTRSRACDRARARAAAREVDLASSTCCCSAHVSDDDPPPRTCRYVGTHSSVGCNFSGIILSSTLLCSSNTLLLVGVNVVAIGCRSRRTPKKGARRDIGDASTTIAIIACCEQQIDATIIIVAADTAICSAPLRLECEMRPPVILSTRKLKSAATFDCSISTATSLIFCAKFFLPPLFLQNEHESLYAQWAPQGWWW